MKSFFFLTPFLCGLLLWSAPGCGRSPDAESGLSDRQFADLLTEAIRLHWRYAGQPDSLRHRREGLFQRYGVTQEDLERFIAARERHPERWRGTVEYLEGRLGEETAASDTLRREGGKERFHHRDADTLANVRRENGKRGRP